MTATDRQNLSIAALLVRLSSTRTNNTMLSFQVTVLLLCIINLSSANYMIMPPMYEVTNEQFNSFSTCIAATYNPKALHSKYDPVCGTDGFSYFNRHSMDCMAVSVPNLQFASYGRCPHEPIFLPMASVRDPWIFPANLRGELEQCIGSCENLFHPVCGSDEKTYQNPCTLLCVGSVNKATLAYEGFCKRDQIAEGKCPPILQPFCGSDGVTYLNYCHLRFAMLTIEGLKPGHIGDCVQRLEAIGKDKDGGYGAMEGKKERKRGCCCCECREAPDCAA